MESVLLRTAGKHARRANNKSSIITAAWGAYFLSSGITLADSLDNVASLRFSHGDSEVYQQALQLDSKVEKELGHDWSLQADARLMYDHQQQLRKHKGRVWLREFYVKGEWLDWNWQIGKQIQNWTQMDNLIAFEQISSRDYKEFILLNFAESARGQWMLSAGKSTENGQWQFIAIPQATPHRLPGHQEWHHFSAPRLRFGYPYQDGQPATSQFYDNDNKGLLAGRYEGFAQQWQWSVQMRYGLDFEPLATNRFAADGSSEGLNLFHENRLSLGGAISTSLGDSVLRSEVSFSPNRHFNLNQQQRLSTTEADQLSAAVGMDTWGPLNTFINVQLLWDTVLNAPDDLVRPDNDLIWSATVRRSFNNDSTHIELRWYGSNEHDGLFRASVNHVINDNWEITTGIDSFYGKDHGYFGQYQKLDRAYLNSNWFF